MTTLTEFLLARIAEDEAVARAAVDEDGRWHVDQSHPLYEAEVRGDIYIYDEGGHTAEQAARIARHDPARVLAECAAKRAIIEQAASYSPELEHGDNGEWAFDVTLRSLAAVYADHPDYQPEWAQKG